MATETERRRIALLAALLALVAASPAVGVTTAQESPQTSSEYFETLRELEELGVIDSYSELETVHTQSITAVQVGTFTDEEAAELDSVIAMLRSFQTAQTRFEAGEYEASLAAANDTEENISQLRQRDQSLAALSELALTRYYEQIGTELASEADTANSTRAEVELRGMAAVAYSRANNPDQASEYTRQIERLRAELAADREQINESQAAMNGFESRCTDCESVVGAITTHHVGVFGLYTQAISVEPRLRDAAGRADQHGLEERRSTLSAGAETASTMRSALALGATALMIVYGAVVALVTVLVASRLFAWKRAYEFAQVDSVVVMGDNNV
ncbi:hypothetical protein [Haloarcula sediminis]|uniref:hypothetical protein n=1 Tax=Haloarcula sediminis TaxID=3111777 RepID=UPI002D799D6D|nr:hypothetical protein [Haloarcula sp. CK38]